MNKDELLEKFAGILKKHFAREYKHDSMMIRCSWNQWTIPVKAIKEMCDFVSQALDQPKIDEGKLSELIGEEYRKWMWNIPDTGIREKIGKRLASAICEAENEGGL